MYLSHIFKLHLQHSFHKPSTTSHHHLLTCLFTHYNDVLLRSRLCVWNQCVETDFRTKAVNEKDVLGQIPQSFRSSVLRNDKVSMNEIKTEILSHAYV